MLTINKYKVFCLCIVLFAVFKSIQAQNIEVHFSGIKSTHGQILLSIFTNDKSFQDDKPIKKIKLKKNNVVNGELLEKLDLEPGTYGFAMLDDEDNDSEMNYSFIGMPKEGFGFSNFYLSGLKRPKFEQFKFTVTKNQKQKVVIKIRYM
jgi:uncharacterized protein (DUF2141 family)